MKVYIDKPIPKTCAGCVMADKDLYCLSNESMYRYAYEDRPAWCPIESDE